MWGEKKEESYLPKINALSIFIYFPQVFSWIFTERINAPSVSILGFRQHRAMSSPPSTPPFRNVNTQGGAGPAESSPWPHRKGSGGTGTHRTHLPRGALEAIKPETHSPIIPRGESGTPSVGTAGEGMGSRCG